MLARNGEPFWPRFTDSSCLEDNAVLVKACERVLNGGERVLVNDWTTSEITEFEVGGKCPNHILRDMAFERREINLFSNIN